MTLHFGLQGLFRVHSGEECLGITSGHDVLQGELDGVRYCEGLLGDTGTLGTGVIRFVARTEGLQQTTRVFSAVNTPSLGVKTACRL